MDEESESCKQKSQPNQSTTMTQFLKTGLNTPNVLCTRFPNMCFWRTSDRPSTVPHYQMSWSVFKAISSVFKHRTVSCQTLQQSSESNQVLKKHKLTTTLEEDIRNYLEKETPKDRLHRAWYSNRYIDDNPPEDVELVATVAGNMFLVGLLFGFFKHGYEEGNAYRVRSRTTLFGSKSLANKRMAGVVVGYGLRKGIKTGLFAVSLTMPFVALWRLLCIYYNTSAPWTFALSAGTVCSIWKTGLGLKGAVGGMIIGSFLGGLFGIPTTLLLQYCGLSQQEINRQQVEQKMMAEREHKKYVVQRPMDLLVIEDDDMEKLD